MKINLIREPFCHIIIEDVFNHQDYNLAWNEILFLQPKMKQPENTGASHNQFGAPNKSGVGIFLQEFYKSPIYSDIYRCTRNFFGAHVLDACFQLDHYFNLYKRIIADSILIQCYRNGDYYLPHQDNCIFTILTLMHETPKKYSGGEIFFPSYNYEVPLKNNCSLIFPSSILHEVKEVKCDTIDPRNFRYTISMFLEDRLIEEQNAK